MGENVIDRYRGVMLGLAVGDALGCPVEGLKAGHIQQLYGRIEGYVDPEIAWRKSPHRWRIPGLYSDDTQQAMALADTLVACHGFEAQYFARLLKGLAEADVEGGFGAHRGTGPNFRAAVRKLQEGVKPFLAGMASGGIGAAMRVAAVGLYYADDENGLLAGAVEQGLITHRDPRALALAAGVAFAVARGVGAAWDAKRAKARIEELIAFIERAEKFIEREYIQFVDLGCSDFFGLVTRAVKGFPYYLDLERKQVWNQIVAEANRGFPEHKITEPGQGFALAGGVSALFLGLSHGSFSDAVLEAVHLGKDTDTMAAIAGAMTAARQGEEAIPQEWLKGLKNREQVALRGEALYQRSGQGLPLTPLLEMEKRLTQQEDAARKILIEKLIRRGEVSAESFAPKPPEKKKPAEPVKPKPWDTKGKGKERRREKAPWKKYDPE